MHNLDLRTIADAGRPGLLTLGVSAPLRLCPVHVGSVSDADGREVFVVDPNNEKPDAWVRDVSAQLVMAVNQSADFL